MHENQNIGDDGSRVIGKQLNTNKDRESVGEQIQSASVAESQS